MAASGSCHIPSSNLDRPSISPLSSPSPATPIQTDVRNITFALDITKDDEINDLKSCSVQSEILASSNLNPSIISSTSSPSTSSGHRLSAHYDSFNVLQQRLSSSTMPVINNDLFTLPRAHDRFEIKTIHTIVCDNCNQHNTSELYQCRVCVGQICYGCVHNQAANAGNSDSIPEGNSLGNRTGNPRFWYGGRHDQFLSAWRMRELAVDDPHGVKRDMACTMAGVVMTIQNLQAGGGRGKKVEPVKKQGDYDGNGDFSMDRTGPKGNIIDPDETEDAGEDEYYSKLSGKFLGVSSLEKEDDIHREASSSPCPIETSTAAQPVVGKRKRRVKNKGWSNKKRKRSTTSIMSKTEKNNEDALQSKSSSPSSSSSAGASIVSISTDATVSVEDNENTISLGRVTRSATAKMNNKINGPSSTLESSHKMNSKRVSFQEDLQQYEHDEVKLETSIRTNRMNNRKFNVGKKAVRAKQSTTLASSDDTMWKALLAAVNMEIVLNGMEG